MARRLKRSSLIFGQIQKPATTPSLAGYYKGVASGQTGAVKTLGKAVEEKTRGLGAELGIDETVDADTGEVSTGMGDKFKATVTVPGADGKGGSITGGSGTVKKGEKPSESKTLAGPNITTTGTVRTTTGASSLDDLSNDQEAFKKALETLGKSIADWEASGVDAKAYLDSLLANTRANANEVIKEVNQRLEEENLGQRREEASEIEKQAQNYQNIIANEPGTSNIKALANLSKYYDMARYGAVESGIRQGELALSRQEMQGEKEAMETAEGARSAAIKDYGEQSKRLVGELGTELTEQETEERKKLSEFFDTGKDTLTDEEKRLKGEQENIGKDIIKKEEEAINDISNEVSRDYEDSNLQSVLDNILELPEGRWLRDQGVARLQPLKSELANLADQIEQIKANPNIDNRTKAERLKTLKNDMNSVRQRAIGELLAFMDDENHMIKDPDGALQAISLIGGRSNLMKFITEDQKNTAQRLTEKAANTYLNLATSWSKGWPREVNGQRDWSGFPFDDEGKVYLFTKYLARARSAAGTGVIMFKKQDASNYEKLKKLEKEFAAELEKYNQPIRGI